MFSLTFRLESGAKNCVEAAKQRIEEIVIDLEQQVTIDCVIPQKFHRTIMGSKGSRVQSITTDFDVKIKFPEKSIAGAVETDSNHVNGQASEGDIDQDGSPKPCDIIRITGGFFKRLYLSLNIDLVLCLSDSNHRSIF